MRISSRGLLAGAASITMLCGAPALAKDTPPPAAAAAAPDTTMAAPDTAATEDADIVVTGRTSRSVTQISGAEIQKILPGISPLKALQTLPGVTYLTADPWGNNEQNISLFIHGFNQQQLGYTLDGVPLGDQQYGNYNGLSPQRAIISENVGRVTLASGAGDLGTASTSNLGGTIDTFSSDPSDRPSASAAVTYGSYDALRIYGRIDTGEFANGVRAYVSGARQDGRAWDFNGRQGGYQANGKLVWDHGIGKVTAYFAYSDKTEPNEDATVVAPGKVIVSTGGTEARANVPYTRPFLYPDFAAAEAYFPTTANGFAGSAAYNAAGDNYRNYYSDAQRTDYLGYLKSELKVASDITFSNQLYFHHDDGVGVVAGPITAAGLPGLFSFYYPGVAGSSPTSVANLTRLSGIFGGSGLASRTTEYLINRFGLISTLHASVGNHDIELGGWYENQLSTAYRRWYAVDVNHPSSPYTRPFSYATPLITQYGSKVLIDEFQTHIQDTWTVFPTVTLQFGFKSTFQRARQNMLVQPIPGSFTGSRELPNGNIDTTEAFLPQAGAIWNVTSSESLFVNAQKNIRQFQTSAAAGLSPFALGSQTLFDFFKANTKPETSWTYEGGIRTHRGLGGGLSFEGQLSVYHVDFSNRLLAISPTSTITAIVSGATILQNVGSVRTTGVDVAGTLRFGSHFSIYDALSYNNSKYEDNYLTGTTLVPTKGKNVPGSPDWLNKTVVSANYGIIDLQVIGDYLGKRYTTFTNDLVVVGDRLGYEPGYFTLAGRVGVAVPLGDERKVNVSVNVTNITNKRAASTLSIGAPIGTYNFFPLPPRQVFGMVSIGF